jgi:hypothetical protein
MRVTALQVAEKAGDQSHCKTDADLIVCMIVFSEALG